MKWHDIMWHEVTWHNVTWSYMTWHNVTKRYMTWHFVYVMVTTCFLSPTQPFRLKLSHVTYLKHASFRAWWHQHTRIPDRDSHSVLHHVDQHTRNIYTNTKYRKITKTVLLLGPVSHFSECPNSCPRITLTLVLSQAGYDHHGNCQGLL